jgi:GR25 family glycosyltransferase involved in LPS biosynthesis
MGSKISIKSDNGSADGSTHKSAGELTSSQPNIYEINMICRPSNTFSFHYINLDDRVDRNEITKNEFMLMGIDNYHRFSAIKNKRGALGCSLSHITCLSQAINLGADHICIFEDDIQFLITPGELKQLFEAIQEIDYDGFVFTYSNVPKKGGMLTTTHPLFRRLTSCQSSTGYIVSKHYAATLLDNFTTGFKKFVKNPKGPYAVDQYWNKLQKMDKWFCYYKKMATQFPGFSDIRQQNIKHHPDFDE